MAMSIAHRITGIGLYLGVPLLAWLLIAAASGESAYTWFRWFMATPVGLLLLVGYTWALLHHMLGGVRHLIWDTLHGLQAGEREWLSIGTLAGSVFLTALIFGVLLLLPAGP